MIPSRDAIAKAAFDAAEVSPEWSESWVDATRLPDGESEDDWNCEWMAWDYAKDEFREIGYRMADAVLKLLGESA